MPALPGLPNIPLRRSRIPRPILRSTPEDSVKDKPIEIKVDGVVVGEKVFLPAEQMTSTYSKETRNLIRKIRNEKRDITPRLWGLLRLVQEQCEEIERKELRGIITKMDFKKLEWTEGTLQKTLEDGNALYNFQQESYLFKYGDYLGEICSAYKNHPSWDRGKFGGLFWTDVQKMIKKEQKALKNFEVKTSLKGERNAVKPETHVLDNVEKVAQTMGIPTRSVLWNIATYAIRNNKAHSVVKELAHKKLWKELALQIHNDRRNLRNSVSDELYKPLLEAMNSYEEIYFLDPKATTKIRELSTGQEYVEGCLPKDDLIQIEKYEARKREQEEHEERKRISDKIRTNRLEKRQASQQFKIERNSLSAASSNSKNDSGYEDFSEVEIEGWDIFGET